MNMMYLSLAIVVMSGAVLVGILGYYWYKKRTLLIEDEQNHHYYADEPQFYQTRTTSTLDQHNYGQSAFAASTAMQDKGRFSTLDLFEDQKLQQQAAAQMDDDTDYDDDLEDIHDHDDYSTYSAQQDAYYPQDAAPVHYAQEAAAATTAYSHEEQHSQRQSSLDPEEELLVVYVLAEPGQPFVGYELLQALLSSGLRYGEMNIFHRFERAHGRGTPLFSLASASEPGTFDLNKMGEVSCRGLCLFMHLSDVKDPIIAFERMIDTANQLVEDLGGEVRDARGQVFNNDRLIDYRERVRDYVVTSHSKQHDEVVA